MIPRPIKWLAGKAIRILPEGVIGRLLPGAFAFSPSAVPSPPPAPAGDVRLYVAPANWAGQAWQWAKSAERFLTSVGSTTMYYTLGGVFGYEADVVVPAGAYVASRRWQRAAFQAVRSGYTHVLIEAERQPFGAILDETVDLQVARLQRAGIAVAMVCHGTDIRLPSANAAREPDSPFADSSVPATRAQEAAVRRNQALLRRLGLPVFVSTPDMLMDVPDARWLPVVIDSAQWSSTSEPLRRDVPVVVHAPSRATLKGTDLIEPIVLGLAAQGLVEYRKIEGVPHDEMPAAYAGADIVIDQLRMGIYGVAAVEAMAAGRVVVSHVADQSREVVRSRTGLELPVVEATSATLESVLTDILNSRDRFRTIAATGPAFASTVHDGRLSAEALGTFLD